MTSVLPGGAKQLVVGNGAGKDVQFCILGMQCNPFLRFKIAGGKVKSQRKHPRFGVVVSRPRLQLQFVHAIDFRAF